MVNTAPLKILKASAGSGKTFSLTLHYITLLLSNETRYREILAVTFTNKATAEMKDRILSVLKGLASGQKGQKTEDFRQLLIQRQPQWNATSIQEKAYRVYRKILHDYSHFTVSTIDGFSQKVIRSFTYELNLDSAYKIEMNTSKVKADLTIMLNQLLDDRPDLLQWIIEYAEQKIANNESWNYRHQLMKLAGLIFTENFQEFDTQLKTGDHRETFDQLNKQVLQTTDTFLEALSMAIASFQEVYSNAHIDPSDMSGKSRNKLVIANKISSQVSNLGISDIKKILDTFVGLIDNEKDFSDQKKHVRHDLIGSFSSVLHGFQELQKAFPDFVAYYSVRNNLYFLRLLKEMSDLLAQWRRENGAQLISDSQVLLNKLGLDENNDPTFIWEKIGNRYRYFLFDEFQDTSRIQWKNYSPLLINALGQSEGRLHEHLIVGDVKQSIYRWRNGDWRILLQQVEEQVSSAFNLTEANRPSFIEVSSLSTNFRSLPNIVHFNNYIFEQIPQKLQDVLNDRVCSDNEKDIIDWWDSSGNSTMLTKAYVDSTQDIPQKKQENQKQRGSIEVMYLPVENDRWRKTQVVDMALDKTCTQIGEWIKSGRYRPAQIGILVRRNSEATAVIARLMNYKNQHGLDFEVISGDALVVGADDAVKLLIETLRALSYEGEAHLLYRARVAYLYGNLMHQKSFDPAMWLRFQTNNIEELRGILPDALVEGWSLWADQPLVQLVERLIEVYALGKKGTKHIPYILAFRDIVHSYTLSGERGTLQFLEYWEEDGYKIALAAESKVQAIEVSTIHKSKGLAYDVVVIPFGAWELDGMVNGDFWLSTQDSPFSHLGKIPVKYNRSLADSLFYKQYYEELLFNYMDALNTFYVATTRAVEHLYILAPDFKKEEQTPKTKNEYISDVLHQVLDDDRSPFPIDGPRLLVDHPFMAEKDELIEENTVSIDQYVVSAELNATLATPSKRRLNTILMMEKATRYGTLAHEIISEISSANEAGKIVDRYVEEGMLDMTERANLMDEIEQIFRDPNISTWMGGGYKVWNEASIITDKGETLRPDKVFSNNEETIVLDFKFTADNYVEHKIQVDQYMNTLHSLGYEKIRGFLYYAKSRQLTEVI